MSSLIDAAINRTRTTLLLLLMVVLSGLFSYQSIPIASDPHIEVPFFSIFIFHEGISPEDSERLLVMPAEIELRKIEGVEELTGYASEGSATLLVEFDASADLDQAELDVREAMDRVRPELPSTAEEPIIKEETADDFPLIQVNVAGNDVPERVLYNLAVRLKDEIETIPSVLEADLQGEREEVLEVIVDPRALEAYQLSSEELLNTILRNNRLIPAGSIDTGMGRFSVKLSGVIEEAQDVFDLPVRVNGDTVVTLGDVASIQRTFKDRTNFARVNGKKSISLDVKKRADANVIDTVAAARAIVERLRPTFPAQVEVFYTQDQAPWAQSQVTELQGNIFTALALVMVLVVAALGLRSGIIVGLGIPISFLFSLIIINQLGFTFNFMVMFGMLLGLGMLIDGAIVVTEYADRKMLEGFDRRAAYSLAAKRMFWPVVASVATTLAAFLPLMLWPGVSGKFMSYLPITVFAVLSGSLLYALVFGPVLGSIFGRAGAQDPKSLDALRELEEGDPTKLKTLTGLYAKVLKVSTRYAFTTTTITVLSLFGSFWAYGTFGKGMTFFSDSDPKFAVVTVRARGNLSAGETNALVTEVEEELLQIADIKDLNLFTMLTGGSSRDGFDRIGQLWLEVVDEDRRDRRTAEIFQEIRDRTQRFAGISVEIKEMEQGPPVGKPIQLELSSAPQHSDLLEPTIEQVIPYISSLDGLVDIDDTRSLPGIEWKLEVDRAQAAVYGADVSAVGIAVQLVTNGVKVGEYRPDSADDAVDIRVRYPSQDRGVSALDALRVSTREGMVPISNFVSRTPAPNVDTIQRKDGRNVEYIRANVAEGVLADAKVKEIQAWLDEQDFDPNVKFTFRGANEEQADAVAFVQVAFGLSLLLMFVLLVTQFNSLYQSTLILFAVVMSTAGVLLGLIVTGMPFSAILTGTGIVALAGIVVNNNIVLIDTYNHLKREHPELDYVDLIVRTGAQRLRPVMLTTVTTIFGLLPLASNYSVDLVNRTIVHGGPLSSFWVPLSQAIVSGLTFATLLTLVATPAMLAIPHRLKAGATGTSTWAKKKYAERLKKRAEDSTVIVPNPSAETGSAG
ncbi:MAG: efflux RND transporter permease subunit [Pseudomonadota bacterium]